MLKRKYKETTTRRGKVIDYIGMTFDFTESGQVRVTMANCIDDILSECGVTKVRSSPATEWLFDVRDTARRATPDEEKWFRTNVAKVLYAAKRVRPECLTAVAFLTTRVQVCDEDDVGKLRRLLGYILGTRERGIVLRVGGAMVVRVYIDAAYGVHTSSGKSHTGCAVVVGAAGPVYVKSGKQKIVTKSSTEAEVVGVSDMAAEGIHVANFTRAQGYEVGPVVIYQDNLSCLALMKKGGPTSERSRHINIRHFWLSERAETGEVVFEHLGTKKMFANILTKPVQGAQFVEERKQLTNWE
jgi:exosome complex RNA-binding protein Rrp4